MQKLASRTGGVGLRSVIRLIRDILVDNKLADSTIGELAGPQHFYDVLKVDMEKNADFKEYHNATGLEALFGYLYLSGNQERLTELMEASYNVAKELMGEA